MATTLPAFTALEDSLWLTLCSRALDHRRPHPILGDAMADQIVRTLDYDDRQHHVTSNFINNVALRAKKLDEVTAGFLARHPNAVGLDLGAGLDTRFARLTPPATVDWYDVDSPAVATARKSVIPEHPNAHVIGVDVREGGDWLDTIPSDRPALIVADGLMGFLTQDELVSLLDRLIDHFPSGEIVFNSYTHFAIWVTHHSPGTKAVAQLIKFPVVQRGKDHLGTLFVSPPTWASGPGRSWTAPCPMSSATPTAPRSPHPGQGRYDVHRMPATVLLAARCSSRVISDPVPRW